MKAKIYGIYLNTFLALTLTAIILAFPAQCLSLALNGLNLWFERMIPTLFPFMVLSGIIIRMNLTDSFVKILNPILGGLFHLRPPCIYGMVIGFLCGFPMGAHVTAQLYEKKQISKAEASLLLAFCNNIGPVYFLSFVLPTLSLKQAAPFLFGMYALPFLYGLFLRYAVYQNSIKESAACHYTKEPAAALLTALDESIFHSLFSIAKLGGYMVFFNLLFVVPGLIANFFHLPENLSHLLIGSIGCLLEITGGIGIVQDGAPYLVLCILPFGGLSCIAQTYSMIKNTDLSIIEYIMHKMILTAITVFYYLFIVKLSFLP
ncbi:nucleoside recognition domain-containing protein [Parablautia muri]|uniref:Nucleoside transporter/FeoB GTPase Gate domain-containing protein n=1 Tax=Parablautia muri TaxID=2320879 RepID=A0A9X5GQV2_9FIRM|nr:nucleoside recognition domain-containing protein [Parablautia muri]NBJ91481.1 hypothetical protein [Parablautia muri]